MELLLWITVVTSILYSLQIVAGRPLMPYSLDYSFDSATGLVRLYNRPVMLQFYLLASFVCPRFFTGNVNIYRLLFFVALMCTLGRTGIFISIFSILLAMTFTGRTTKLIKVVVILGLLFLPFFDMVSQRYEGSGTTEDLSNTMSGGYKNFSTGDGTMTYRIAWVYERGEYLIHRPIGEQIFGMGLISGSQDIVYKMYHFRVGLIGEAGLIEQLYTPDISYGNLLTRLGFLGGAIYIVFVISLMILFFRHRKDLPILTICTAQIIVMFIGAFSGSAMSNPSNFVIYFLTLSLLYSKNSEGLLRNRSSKWLFEKNNNNQ